MAGPGRQVVERRVFKLLWVVFLVLFLNSQNVSCFDEIFPNVLKALKDLPVVGFALKSALKTALTPVFQPRGASYSDISRRGEVSDSNQRTPPVTYCYGELGCISFTSDFYHPFYRPINLPPSAREDIRVTFKITSREDPVGVVVPGLQVQQALKSSFKPSRKTKIVVHGFLNGRDMPFLERVPRSLINHYDVNAVWVDWTEGSIALYNRAVANARLVGLEIAHFIKFLQNNMGLKPEDVHLIGHSLGSHICGYAGEKIPGLSRITGLDPAEPFFQHMPPSVRLDPTDARFVDIIHTDSDSILNIGQGFGLRQPIGHLDFYPNDGRSQPGCQPPLAAPSRWLFKGFKNFSKIWDFVEDALGCNHFRVSKLFVDSIASQCPYLAYKCDSYSSYKDGRCTSCGPDGMDCAQMGIHADSWPGVGTGNRRVLFLSTGDERKFCRFHYQILVQLTELPNGGMTRMGELYVIFLAPDMNQVAFDLTAGKSMIFTANKQYDFFLEHDEELGQRQEVLVGWKTPIGSNKISDESIAISRIEVINKDLAVTRYRTSRFMDSVDALTFCNDRGRPVIINNKEVVQIQASTTCFTTT